MRRNKARFVTVCQQSLALGAVLAVLAPATSVISLDVVGTIPGTPSVRGRRSGPPSSPGTAPSRPRVPASTGPGRQESRVETEPVEPVVEEVPLAPARRAAGRTPRATRSSAPPRRSPATARSGVTWGHGQQLKDDQIKVLVRTRTDGTWSTWSAIEYHEEHGPDPDSDEGRKARPGTDPLHGRRRRRGAGQGGDDDGEIPDDVTMAVIEPGESRRHRGRGAGARHRQARQRQARPGRGRRAVAGRDRRPDPRVQRRRDRPAGRRATPRSRRSTPAPSGAPTSGCATPARCTTTRCTPASSTTR